MRSVCVLLSALIIVIGLSVSAQATLINNGGGFIYDTDLGITWLQDANYAKTSGYDADGMMNWSGARTWATTLVYGGYSGWRLPTTVDSSPLVFGYDGTPTYNYGYNITSSERGTCSTPRWGTRDTTRRMAPTRSPAGGWRTPGRSSICSPPSTGRVRSMLSIPATRGTSTSTTASRS